MSDKGVAGGAASVQVSQLSVEDTLDPRDIDRFLAVYRMSMEPLEELAPGRQSLTDEEFRDEMAQPSVTRYVGWEDDEPVALCWMGNDLNHVPWISPPYFAKKFPELYEAGLIFYISGVVVRPEARGKHWSATLFERMITDVARVGGMSAFDCSRYVIDVIGLDKIIESTGEKLIRAKRHDLDAQLYLAYETFGLLEDDDAPVIDLRDGRAVVDLTD